MQQALTHMPYPLIQPRTTVDTRNTARSLLPHLDIHILAVQPLLALPQQTIMLFAAVSRHIRLDLHPHHSLLTVSEVSVSHRKASEQSVVDAGNLAGIDWNQLVLLVEMPDVFDLPFSVGRGVAVEEHAETAIRLGICFIPSGRYR